MQDGFPSIREVVAALESWAPLGTAASWDNSGLQVGNADRRIRVGIVALDLVPMVVEEAIQLNAELIVTHHPLLFRPVSRLTPETFPAGLALRLAEERIALYSMHTNLDGAPDGVSVALSQRLGLLNVRCLDPAVEHKGGFGAIGKMAHEMTLENFLQHVSTILGCPTLRYTGDLAMPIHTVALCGGAGSDLMPKAIDLGADVYITGDLRYHQYFDVLGASGEATMALIDAGHYETEVHTEELIQQQLTAQFPRVQWYRTKVRTGPVRSYTKPD